ncbi:MAG: hypothetical protein M3O34_19670 [Chloroflexota bacterium]|nr:hypothetical protein [Chloroflexota bacterium]
MTNALGIAIDARHPAGSTVIHSDQGTQNGSWDFWSRVQVELLDRRVWSTRLDLATALFEYLEIFHNRQRRHSSLGMLMPFEFEARQQATATSTVA